MRKLIEVARILLGAIFLVLGLNGFFLFIPVPEYHPFMQLMVDSGFIYVEKAIEVICGILLLTNRFKPLALLLLGPIIVNIFLYHILMDPRNWPIAFVNMVFYGFLVWDNWDYFKPFLESKVHKQE